MSSFFNDIESHLRTARLVNQAEEIIASWSREKESIGISPNVDMVNTDKECIIYCEIPGINKEDISISIEGYLLKISAERTQPEEKERYKYVSREIKWGKIEKTFRLSSFLDLDRISAELENGILAVKIPKKKAEKNQIEIKIK
jgi:HSP20 family protein